MSVAFSNVDRRMTVQASMASRELDLLLDELTLIYVCSSAYRVK